MSLRPKDPPKLTTGDLLPGDVLLSNAIRKDGSFWDELDKLILAIDQGDYSHASIWDGKYVIECLTTGVQIHDPLSMTLEEQSLVDVYRFSLDGHRFGDPEWPVEPVLDAARAFEGRGYGYTRLVLLGIVILTSEVPQQPILDALVRIIGDDLAKHIDEWLGKSDQMICSEVIAGAWWDAKATPAHKYGLPIEIGGTRHLLKIEDAEAESSEAESPAHAEFLRLRNEVASRIQPVVPAPAEAPKGALTVVAGSPPLPAGFVSPGDLQRSPSLSLVGTLKEPGYQAPS